MSTPGVVDIVKAAVAVVGGMAAKCRLALTGAWSGIRAVRLAFKTVVGVQQSSQRIMQIDANA
jgi:hypothetical protein